VEGEKRASLLFRVTKSRSVRLGSCQRTPSRWIQGASSRRIPKPPGFCAAVGGFDKIREMRRLCQAHFPLDLLVRRPEEIEIRYREVIRSCAKLSTMARCSMVEPWSAVPEWIAKAEGDWEAPGNS